MVEESNVGARWRLLGSLAFVAAASGLCLLWWSTAVSTSMARIAAMQPIESYAFSVYHQIVHNLSMHGLFEQTVHQGYDDSWTWSGHRAPALFSTAALYRLDASAFGLARMQIFQVLLGALPAAALGRMAARGRRWGWLLGVAVYLGTPAVLALALQDYQDLVLAIPFLLMLAAALRSRRIWWVPLAVLMALLPREETVVLIVAMSVVVVPWSDSGSGWSRVRWRRWGANIVLCAGLAGGYAFAVETAFPATETAYKMPLASAVGDLGGTGGVIFFDGWPFMERFYLDLLVPTGMLGLVAPLAALPGLGLTAFHMAIPMGHGIDRSWSGHCHHLAPAVPFLVVASIDGAARLLRFVGRPVPDGLARTAVTLVAGLGCLVWVGLSMDSFATRQNMRVSLLPLNPTWVHPVWSLAERLPDDAIPVAPKDLSPAIANRRVAYTLDGSLGNKAPLRGLGAATHAIVDTRQDGVEARVGALAGVEVVAAGGPFRLYTWSRGAVDPNAASVQSFRPRKARPWFGTFKRRDDIAGVPPFESGKPPEGSHAPPSVRLPW